MQNNLCAVATDFHDDLKAMLPKLRRHGLMLTRDIHRTEDLVQDTVVRALVAQNTFQPGSNFAAWMHRIMRNEFITGIRKGKVRHTLSLDDVMGKHLSVAAPHDDRLVARELIAAIGELPPPQREALLLSAMSDLNYDQIAEVMNCRSGTIKSRISRARQQLHDTLMGVALGDDDADSPKVLTPEESDDANRSTMGRHSILPGPPPDRSTVSAALFDRAA